MTQPAPVPPRYNVLMSVYVGIVCFVAGVLVGFIVLPEVQTQITAGRCDENGWWAQAAPHVTEFIDTVETATQTARASLSGVILTMRQKQRDFEGVSYTECVANIRTQISNGMEAIGDGFNDFLGQATPTTNFQQGVNGLAVAYEVLIDMGLTPDERMRNVLQS
jgi:hypothetical protein